MAVRRREGGDLTGKRMPGFPYPFNTDLHWLWGWGQRVEAYRDREPFEASEHDWAILNPCRESDNAMMRFSLDYQPLIDEIRRGHKLALDRWGEALDNPCEDYQVNYCQALGVLAARIFKVCELISEREDSSGQMDPQESVRAHAEKLFPKSVPQDPDLVDAILKLDSERSESNTDIQIIRKITREPADNCPIARRIQGRIRALRARGGTTLPPR